MLFYRLGFNRTIVELKLTQRHRQMAHLTSFNRTIVELKSGKAYDNKAYIRL